MTIAQPSLSAVLLACALALPAAQAQSPGAAAAAAQPAMSGTQGGTQPTLQQGGMSSSAKDASQVNIQLRRRGQEDMPQGTPASSMPPASTATTTLAPMTLPAASALRR